MNPLLITGFGTTINVNKRRLIINNPHTKKILEFHPHQVDNDHIIIDGFTGAMSFEAMRWLMRHGIQLTLLDWNGHLLGTWMPKETNNGRLRIKQYEKYLDPKIRYNIACKIIEEKIDKSFNLLEELSNYYEEIDSTIVRQQLKELNKGFQAYRGADEKCGELRKLMVYEAKSAKAYWDMLGVMFNSRYPEINFKGRRNKSNSWASNASDEINALLNYGYAILESQARKCINAVGLDMGVGYLHEMKGNGHPLVYDVQELYRWLVDLSVIQLLEDKKLKRSDFIVTEHYHIRLEEHLAQALIAKLKLNFNKSMPYKKKNYSYEYILLDNIQQLANYIVDKSKDLKFEIPAIKITRDDDLELREFILTMTPDERKKLGINRNTLWYMRENLKKGKKINIYDKVKNKIT